MPRRRDDPFANQPRTVEELQRRVDEWMRQNPIPTDPEERRKYIKERALRSGLLRHSDRFCPHCGEPLLSETPLSEKPGTPTWDAFWERFQEGVARKMVEIRERRRQEALAKREQTKVEKNAPRTRRGGTGQTST